MKNEKSRFDATKKTININQKNNLDKCKNRGSQKWINEIC